MCVFSAVQIVHPPPIPPKATTVLPKAPLGKPPSLETPEEISAKDGENDVKMNGVDAHQNSDVQMNGADAHQNGDVQMNGSLESEGSSSSKLAP